MRLPSISEAMQGCVKNFFVCLLLILTSCSSPEDRSGTAAGFAGSATVRQESFDHSVVPLVEYLPGHGIQTVRGDPEMPGLPYVIRIHNDAGYVVLPHTHAEDENIVVLRGDWHLGAGERFDSSSLQRLESGAYGFVPKRMPHFAWSESATTIQVHGIGPFSTDWVEAVYDLTDTGVAHVTAGGRPGTPVAAAPARCFTFDVGTRVRTGSGEGRVIRGLCSPSSQLTQYRIQNDNGEHFWATADKLEKL